MPKYLFQVSYSTDGVKGLLHDGGTKRKSVVKTMIESAGGTLEAFYYAFGGYDVICIADLPDDTSAAAVSLTASAVYIVSNTECTCIS